MSLESGNPEEDERLLLESLERNLHHFDQEADRELRRMSGHDEPLLDPQGNVTQVSAITFWRETKEWVTDALPKLRFEQTVIRLFQDLARRFH
jgi:hypothetical protein